jgi:NADH:ubiquinone reductase (H+-translocating)
MLEQRSSPPRVVIVGVGFGGLAAARSLRKAPVEVVLIDRRNYHLFQPLLYQVATAALSPADIAWPIRSIVAGQANARVELGRVTGVDTGRQEVIVDDERRVAYDHLILATGARHAYFGRDEWEEVAPGLKKIDDATLIRQRVLIAFERAEVAPDPEDARRLLSFVVVGGGPTGVEMAGAIAELARYALARDFSRINPKDARVVLVEAGPRLLASFAQTLSARAKEALEELGVEVRLGGRVTACDAQGVVVDGERIHAGTIVWGAGVIASPAGKWLDVPCDPAGRVKVGPDLEVPGYPNVFVIGDTVFALGPNGRPVPGIAPAAKQMGHHVGRLIAARVAGRPHPGPFRYRHMGSLATIGRKAAVADFGRVRLSGLPAWILWAVAHVYFLIGWRNRLVVSLNWFWSYLTFERGARLITGASSEATGVTPAVHDLALERRAA